LESETAQLIARMTEDLENWSAEPVDLQAKYGESIAAVGAVPLLAELFRRFGDSRLLRWLIRLAFVWRDFPYPAWQEILHRLSADEPALYQLVSFASEFLAIDMVRAVREDPALPQTARDWVSAQFPRGGPLPGSDWATEVLADNGIEASQLWSRLADEGAPMRIELP
jgi:hypothetical protein